MAVMYAAGLSFSGQIVSGTRIASSRDGAVGWILKWIFNECPELAR